MDSDRCAPERASFQPSATPSATELLSRWSEGDRDAADQVLPLLYEELRNLAAHHMLRERSGHTLQPTALVHEAYVRLVGRRTVRFASRGQFLAYASGLIRRILVDHHRERHRLKRGGYRRRVTLHCADGEIHQRSPDLLDLDDALERLAAVDPEKALIIELRFFGGLTVDEVAAVLKRSSATVFREWRKARAWLFRALDDAASSEVGNGSKAPTRFDGPESDRGGRRE